MNNNLSISFLLCAIIFFSFYMGVSIKEMLKTPNDSILNTFPFETNKKKKMLSVFILLVSFIFGSLFIAFLYPAEYRFGFQLASLISCIVCFVCFLLLNLINLSREKVHYLIFCVFFVGSLSLSISLGGSAIYFYNLLEHEPLALVIAIILFLISILEVIYVVPKLNVTLKLDREEINNEIVLKKPRFVKLCFLEWIFSFEIFLKMILILLVILMV